MNRRMLLYLLAIALSSVALSCFRSKETVSTEEDNSNKMTPDHLCVTIWPQTTRISVREYFGILLRVTNASDRPQSFEVFSSSWRDHWKPDNPRITTPVIVSMTNTILTIKLQPGESYEKKMEAVQLRDGLPLTSIAFKMGFTPRDEKTTYWSNRVVLGIKPQIAKLDGCQDWRVIHKNGVISFFDGIPSEENAQKSGRKKVSGNVFSRFSFFKNGS